MAALPARPDLTELTAEQKDRVRRQVRRQQHRCGGCGSEEFVVGDALYLGFLFRSEDQDAYLVALSCADPSCPTPRTGIRLHAAQFLPTYLSGSASSDSGTEGRARLSRSTSGSASRSSARSES